MYITYKEKVCGRKKGTNYLLKFHKLKQVQLTELKKTQVLPNLIFSMVQRPSFPLALSGVSLLSSKNLKAEWLPHTGDMMSIKSLNNVEFAAYLKYFMVSSLMIFAFLPKSCIRTPPSTFSFLFDAVWRNEKTQLTSWTMQI